MKNTILSLIIILSASISNAEGKCAAQAESYITGHGWTMPAEFRGLNPDGNELYQVRTNQDGGEAAWEVVVEPETCAYISHRLLWSE